MPWSMLAIAARADGELGMLLERLLRKIRKKYWTKRSAKKAQNGRKSAQKGANGRKSKKTLPITSSHTLSFFLFHN